MSERLIRRLEQRRERETDLLGVRSFEGALRVVLIFPNTYDVGMSNLGVHAIYRVLSSLPGVSCERAFLPDPADLREHRRTRAPLRSVETQTPLSQFDVLAFSVSFEGDYSNVVRVLDLAGVPPPAAERNDFHPIVIAGGPAMTFNPTPLSDFMDAFAIGEGEPLCPSLGEALLDTWAGRRTTTRRDYRQAALQALAQVPGLYVPLLFDASSGGRVVRRVLRDVAVASESVILTPDTQFSGTFLIEAQRGCGRGCRFCAAGHIFRPPRFRREEDILARVRRAGPLTRRAGLVGPALGDHPALAEIVTALAGDGFSVSASSVRVDRMGDRLAEALAAGGSRTVTLAPEAGTHRLRRVANKDFPDEAVLQAVDRLAAAGIPRVKLYFLYGLPTETDEDVLAIARLCARIRTAAPGIEMELSINPFVPKPFTPWQWEAMTDLGTLDRRRALLREALPAELASSASFDGAKQAALQALLARGCAKLGGTLLRVARTREGWSDWQSALRDDGIALEDEVFRPREVGAKLPGDFIDVGLSPDFLMAERERSVRGQAGPPCEVHACDRCGACEQVRTEPEMTGQHP